jgi:hypothetical protein
VVVVVVVVVVVEEDIAVVRADAAATIDEAEFGENTKLCAADEGIGEGLSGWAPCPDKSDVRCTADTPLKLPVRCANTGFSALLASRFSRGCWAVSSVCRFPKP